MAAGDGGIFGKWIDDGGLPAFEYTLDHVRDPRAEWDTRLTGPSRLHWHQLGNDRIIAIATNDGWVQLYSHEHGPRWINQYRGPGSSYAGGVSYLLDRVSGRTMSTFASDLPGDASLRRVFGCGYFRVVVRHDGLELDRVIFAPFGDGRLLASSVRVRNVSSHRRQLRHGEYWDIWLTSIDCYDPSVGLDQARELNDQRSRSVYAGYTAGWDDGIRGLRARHEQGEMWFEALVPPHSHPQTRPNIVAVPLGTPVTGWAASRADVFGSGGRAAPAGLASPPCRPLDGRPPGQDAAFLLCTDIDLAPGEEAELGFGYGAAPPAQVAAEVAALGEDADELFEATRHAWQSFLPRVRMGGEDWLERELAWGAYYVRSGATYHDGFRSHTLPQGGAYQYLRGFNAGPRATAQHALPLVWLAPELAADAARFTMAQTTPQGEIPWAEAGSGVIEPWKYLPSDNDLWLLWLVAEYVLATRDRRFLQQSVSYWPAPYTRPEPVWDHCARALDHLLTSIGTGSHGLLRVRYADWNDVFVADGQVPMDQAWRDGESTLNTAMAVHVLRRFAELADYAAVPDTAVRCRDSAAEFAAAVRRCWRGRQLNRGWRAADCEAGAEELFLEPQPWALIGGVLDPGQQQALVREIRQRCADPYATTVFARDPDCAGPGSVMEGSIWPSINSTLAWGLSMVDPAEGWRELTDNTLHHHAEVYPRLWMGVWSGPDMYLGAKYGRHAGQTWSSGSYFSMQAWPVQILFPHSEPLNASLWLAGIQPTAAGLRIDPRLPFDDWSWDGGLLAVRYGSDAVSGEFEALAAEVIEVEVVLPRRMRGGDVAVQVDGRSAAVRRRGNAVRFLMPVRPGRRTSFRCEPGGRSEDAVRR